MIGEIIEGNYRILNEIGEGGMGTVYLSEYPHYGLFAIKSLAPQLSQDRNFRERFFKEGDILFSLRHDNIVQAYTILEENNNLFLVMEYVDGGDLQTLIERQGSFSEPEALSIFNDVLRGLNYAHSRGVIHRDVKPSNILLNKNGTAKIMDFGIALTAGGRRLTKTGLTLGTPQYMSPEQITRPKQLDHRTDVYSMGIVLYEMLAGKVPFDGKTDFEIKQKQVNEPPPDIRLIVSDISNMLANVLNKALEKEPDNRFDGCGQFLEYIEAYQIEISDVNQNGKQTDSQRRADTKNPVGVYIFVAVIILFILFIFTRT